MNDQIRDLLHEVADDVEPGDRLGAVRAATSAETRARARRSWWLAGAAGLAAASVVAALLLPADDTSGGADRGPATGGATSGTTSDDADPTLEERRQDMEEMRRAADGVLAVYYLGDTPAGPRLFREFRRLDETDDPLTAAVSAAVGLGADQRPLAPMDPDYRTVWPSVTRVSTDVDGTGEAIDVDLVAGTGTSLGERGSLTFEEAALGVEALVRTAQAAIGERLPVRLLVDGRSTDTVLGVPVAEPLSAALDADVLAPVNLSDPFEGQVADHDQPLVVTGRTAHAGTVTVRVQRTDEAQEVLAEVSVAPGGGSRSFTVSLDLSRVPPGDHDVVVLVADPVSGTSSDSRRITVVD